MWKTCPSGPGGQCKPGSRSGHPPSTVPRLPEVARFSKVHFLRFLILGSPSALRADKGPLAAFCWLASVKTTHGRKSGSMHGECGLVSPQIYLIAVRNLIGFAQFSPLSILGTIHTPKCWDSAVDCGALPWLVRPDDTRWAGCVLFAQKDIYPLVDASSKDFEYSVHTHITTTLLDNFITTFSHYF